MQHRVDIGKTDASRVERDRRSDIPVMDFISVWSAKEWTPEQALTIALDAVSRAGRQVSLVEWCDPDGSGERDFLSIAESNGWSDTEAVAAIIAYGDESGFCKQLDAHARRVARRTPPDPDHYGT